MTASRLNIFDKATRPSLAHRLLLPALWTWLYFYTLTCRFYLRSLSKEAQARNRGSCLSSLEYNLVNDQRLAVMEKKS